MWSDLFWISQNHFKVLFYTQGQKPNFCPKRSILIKTSKIWIFALKMKLFKKVKYFLTIWILKQKFQILTFKSSQIHKNSHFNPKWTKKWILSQCVLQHIEKLHKRKHFEKGGSRRMNLRTVGGFCGKKHLSFCSCRFLKKGLARSLQGPWVILIFFFFFSPTIATTTTLFVCGKYLHCSLLSPGAKKYSVKGR